MICMNVIYMDCICIHCILFLLGTVASEVLDQRSRVVCQRSRWSKRVSAEETRPTLG